MVALKTKKSKAIKIGTRAYDLIVKKIVKHKEG